MTTFFKSSEPIWYFISNSFCWLYIQTCELFNAEYFNAVFQEVHLILEICSKANVVIKKYWSLCGLNFEAVAQWYFGMKLIKNVFYISSFLCIQAMIYVKNYLWKTFESLIGVENVSGSKFVNLTVLTLVYKSAPWPPATTYILIVS